MLFLIFCFLFIYHLASGDFCFPQVMREREASNEIIVDQEATIKKFRELVQKQQEQNIELRQALEKETNKPIATPSEIIDFKVSVIR